MGGKRPNSATSLGKVLSLYTSTGAHSYDREFTETIKRVAPDWFHDTRMARKKQQLLELASQGAIRPKKTSSLGVALRHYVNPAEPSYDAKFTAAIRQVAPQSWWKSGGKRRVAKEASARRAS